MCRLESEINGHGLKKVKRISGVILLLLGVHTAEVQTNGAQGGCSFIFTSYQ